MLYSKKDRVWKIADFGLTREGTSKRAKTTCYAGGTGGYRAPELCSESSKYNNKVDIWAFGCIAYELVTRKRAFKGDYHTMQYNLDRGQSPIQLQPISANPDVTMACLNFIVKSALHRDPLERPSASAILELLNTRFERILETAPVPYQSRRFISYRPQDMDWAKICWIACWYS